MNIIIIAATAVILIAGVFFRQRIEVGTAGDTKPAPTSQSATPSATPNANPSEEPTQIPTKTPQPTKPPATPTSGSTGSGQDAYVLPNYPGAAVTEQSATRVVMTSSDSPDSITSWYESKIREMGFNVKSFVKTKANDNVNNKLSGSSSKAEITVEITRPSGQSLTRIEVTQ